MRSPVLVAITGFTMFAAASAPAAQEPRRTADAVVKYLDAALDTLRRVALRRDSVDWNALRDTVRVRSSGAQTTDEAWPALQWALRFVDGHSFLQTPRPMPDARAAAAKPNEKAAQRPFVRPAVSGRLIDRRFGYILVPSIGSSRASFVDSLQALIREYDSAGACGYAWAGSDTVPDWAAHGTQPPYEMTHRSPPVALLIGRETASSGEATLIAFLGRSSVRTFGDSTAGFASVNNGYRLSDSANMVITIGFSRDRTGRQYGLRLTPAEILPAGSDPGRDPPLERAVAWLQSQPVCAR